MDIHHRPGTWDHAIFTNVVKGEYGPLDFRDKTVVDIGAHIGAFTIMAALHGARQVHAFEAGSTNFRLLQSNCRDLANVRCTHAAVWSAQAPTELLRWRPNQCHENTGGGTVLRCAQIAGFEMSCDGAEDIRSIPFDEVVEAVGRVDLLKIDAEGSEYPILLTSQRLDAVQEIVGEYHVLGTKPAGDEADGLPAHWNVDSLMAHLQDRGFLVEREQHPRNGIFRARRAVK